MLYSLAIEHFLQKLRKALSGFIIPHFESRFLLSAYADVVIVKSQKDIENLIKTVTNFGKTSSVKINWNKSKALLIGKCEHERLSLPQGLNLFAEV